MNDIKQQPTRCSQILQAVKDKKGFLFSQTFFSKQTDSKIDLNVFLSNFLTDSISLVESAETITHMGGPVVFVNEKAVDIFTYDQIAVWGFHQKFIAEVSISSSARTIEEVIYIADEIVADELIDNKKVFNGKGVYIFLSMLKVYSMFPSVTKEECEQLDLRFCTISKYIRHSQAQKTHKLYHTKKIDLSRNLKNVNINLYREDEIKEFFPVIEYINNSSNYERNIFCNNFACEYFTKDELLALGLYMMSVEMASIFNENNETKTSPEQLIVELMMNNADINNGDGNTLILESLYKWERHNDMDSYEKKRVKKLIDDFIGNIGFKEQFNFIDIYFKSESVLLKKDESNKKTNVFFMAYLESLHALNDKFKAIFNYSFTNDPEFVILRIIRNYYHHEKDIKLYKLNVNTQGKGYCEYNQHLIIPMKDFARSIQLFCEKNKENERYISKQFEIMYNHIDKDTLDNIKLFEKNCYFTVNNIKYELGFDIFKYIYNMSNIIADKCREVDCIKNKKIISLLDNEKTYSTEFNIPKNDFVGQFGLKPIMTTEGFVFIK